ncbi:MAG: class I SAM-dependent methyltransferase [Vicinamibacterales bacterium]
MNAMEPPTTRAEADEYRSGAYFREPDRHSADAEYKARMFVSLLRRNPGCADIRTVADVGCGSGAATIAVVAGMDELGFEVAEAVGYDISPHVASLRHPRVRFVHEDFVASGRGYDLVTLFDVVEHVPDPIEFLRLLSQRTRFVGLHLPLDDSLNCAARDLFRSSLKDPGHLLALDTASALNLLAFAGLRVVDYEYVLGFRAPSAAVTVRSASIYPLRAVLAAVSPWLLAKTLGGVSLMVLCRTAPPPGGRR